MSIWPGETGTGTTAAAEMPKSKFTAPIPGIEYVHFTHGDSKVTE